MGSTAAYSCMPCAWPCQGSCVSPLRPISGPNEKTLMPGEYQPLISDKGQLRSLQAKAQRLTRPGTGAVGSSALDSPVHAGGRAGAAPSSPAAWWLMVVTSAWRSWKRRWPHLSSRWWLKGLDGQRE
jgi:hypothetical protein